MNISVENSKLNLGKKAGARLSHASKLDEVHQELNVVEYSPRMIKEILGQVKNEKKFLKRKLTMNF